MKKVTRTQYTVHRWLRLFVFVFLLSTFYCLLSTNVMAQDGTEYRLLAPLPGISSQEGKDDCITKDKDGGVVRDKDGNTIPCATAGSYIPGMIKLVIGLAGVLAVIKIMFGGILYMSTDAIGGKSEAKSHITNALWGLLLIISAWVILYTLNPKLVEIDLKIEAVKRGEDLNTNLGKAPTKDDVDKEKSVIGCVNCAAVAVGFIDPKLIGTVLPKPPVVGGGGGAGCDAEVACYINVDLAQKLKDLTEKTREINKENKTSIGRDIKWQVTEMFPPTVKHLHPCHNPDNSVSGMCVDVSINASECAGSNNCHPDIARRDAWKLAEFIEAATLLGLHVVYELPANMKGRETYLKREVGRLKPNIPVHIVSIDIKHEHFSVYLNSSVRNTR